MGRSDKKSVNIDNLYENTVEVASISCTKCGIEKTEMMLAANLLYDEGWRSTDKNVYCPKCAKRFRIK